MRDILPGIISFIVTISLFFALVFGLEKCSMYNDEILWNNGHCDVCGGTWKYEQAVGHRYSTAYIYVCEDCGKRIEIDNER